MASQQHCLTLGQIHQSNPALFHEAAVSVSPNATLYLHCVRSLDSKGVVKTRIYGQCAVFIYIYLGSFTPAVLGVICNSPPSPFKRVVL